MEVNEKNIVKIKNIFERMLQYINMYKYVVESYVIEFFVEDHWSHLPMSWQMMLKDMDPPQVAEFFYGHKYSTVPPLSLLAFIKCSQALSIPRLKTKIPTYSTKRDKEIKKRIFEKHVSAKKRHEIEKLSTIITNLCQETNCNFVLDIGAGRGHLSRYLSLGQGLDVSTIEMQKQLVKCAVQYDIDAMQWLQKIHKQESERGFGDSPTLKTPKHNIGKVNAYPEVDNLSSIIANQCKDSNPKVLLTGLHACGDLSTTLFRKFVESREIQTLVSVSCCYMKLSDHGYPLSYYVKSLPNHELGYKTREISCHAIEDYEKQLKDNGIHLKMHTYRAVLEVIIRKRFPVLSRSRIQVGKKAYMWPFEEYVKKALTAMGEKFSALEDQEEIQYLLSKWHNVVTYYNITQMISPVIESAILLDRMIYLYEKDYSSKCEVLFEPTLSPRCFGIVSTKFVT